jgi:hypothetical protein
VLLTVRSDVAQAPEVRQILAQEGASRLHPAETARV